MAEAATPIFHSLDDFIAWEEQQELRYELLPGGVITMMAGGTGDHDAIATNVIMALGPRLRGSGCRIHGSNLKVTSEDARSSVYPDAFVRCGPPVGEGIRTDDPVVVFEVLSEGTASSDLTRKRQVYKAMPSVRVIVYVTPRQYRLDIVRRGADGRFDDEVLEGQDAVLELPEIGATVAMAEIYADTSLTSTAGDAP
jgi:Uma2 family endonuclease